MPSTPKSLKTMGANALRSFSSSSPKTPSADPPSDESSSESSDDESSHPATPKSSSADAPSSSSSPAPLPSSPTPTPSKASSDAHRQLLEAAAEAAESAAPGSWLISVHAIEVRELRATDPDGSADPVVIVEVNFGTKKKKAVTRVVNNDRNAVFDETFKFEFPDLTKPELEMGQVMITVLDADISVAGHGAGDVIGSWNADIIDAIYTRPDHEFYRQFVCLENEEATSDAESGTQGFLKLTVSLLGPGDKPVIHNLEKEQAAERKAREKNSDADGAMSTVLPTSMGTQELRFLVIKLHSLENLCTPSSFVFVTVDFGQNSFSTPANKTLPQPHASNTTPAR